LDESMFTKKKTEKGKEGGKRGVDAGGAIVETCKNLSDGSKTFKRLVKRAKEEGAGGTFMVDSEDEEVTAAAGELDMDVSKVLRNLRSLAEYVGSTAADKLLDEILMAAEEDAAPAGASSSGATGGAAKAGGKGKRKRASKKNGGEGGVEGGGGEEEGEEEEEEVVQVLEASGAKLSAKRAKKMEEAALKGSHVYSKVASVKEQVARQKEAALRGELQQQLQEEEEEEAEEAAKGEEEEAGAGAAKGSSSKGAEQILVRIASPSGFKKVPPFQIAIVSVLCVCAQFAFYPPPPPHSILLCLTGSQLLNTALLGFGTGKEVPAIVWALCRTNWLRCRRLCRLFS
jgi:hypothetical protein